MLYLQTTQKPVTGVVTDSSVCSPASVYKDALCLANCNSN